MQSLAHKVIVRTFAPTVVVGIWTYAHLESVRQRAFISMWKEGTVVRVGNPYTASVPRQSIEPSDGDGDRGGTGNDGIASADADF